MTRANNSSGYQGVSWHKAARKWSAYLRENGTRRYLGLFETRESARAAYDRAASKLPAKDKSADTKIIKKNLIGRVQKLYDTHGIVAISTPFLEEQRLYARLLAIGLKQPALLKELGLAEEYAAWRSSSRRYRGEIKPKWSWELVVKRAKELKEREGDLPTVQWCRKNGFSQLTNFVHKSGRTWEDLRVAIGSSASAHFYESRNGMRWRSRPEACLSNFLYARGIEHKRGERYPKSYSIKSGRHHGHFDMHFVSARGVWIDVEVWGDLNDKMSQGRYRVTRTKKELWNANRKNFIGIQYQDCLSDVRLGKILESFIGFIKPFRFEKPQDQVIETAHWSNADELLVTCKQLAAQRPDGIFPSENWLRKRGKYVDREGPTYNTLAVRVNQWLKGTRAVRKLLGHDHASTIEWTPERVIAAWQAFEKKYELTPSQCQGKIRRSLAPEVAAESSKIYQAARLHRVLSQARNGQTRKVKWTREYALTAWRSFVAKYGLKPSECMSATQRRKLPSTIKNEAANIYGAVRRLGLLEFVRK